MVKESSQHFEGGPGGESFEEQFKHLNEVRLPGGIAEVGDFTPEHAKNEVPLFLLHGWGLGLRSYESALKQFYDDNWRVLSFAHPRRGDSLDSSMNAPELSVDPSDPSKKFPDAELRKALNILEVLEEKNIEQVDAVAHSESALNVVYAALMYPEKFRNIVFVNPAGMMEEEQWSRLGKGFASQSTRAPSLKDLPVTDSERAVGKAAAEEVVAYFRKNPGRAIGEIAAIKNGHRELKDLLPYLHDLGINFAVISAEDDPVFPHGEVEKAAQMDAVSSFISVPGGHGIIGDRPEIVAPIVESLLEELAKKKKTKEQEQALAEREYHAGVRYVPGEGLVISPYIKRGTS